MSRKACVASLVLNTLSAYFLLIVVMGLLWRTNNDEQLFLGYCDSPRLTSSEIGSILEREGMLLHARDSHGRGILHYLTDGSAATEERAQAAAVVVELGLAPNRTTGLGKTALHIAARRGDLSMVRTLVAAGTRLDLCDVLGETALDKAEINDHTEIAQFLADHGAVRKRADGDVLRETIVAILAPIRMLYYRYNPYRYAVSVCVALVTTMVMRAFARHKKGSRASEEETGTVHGTI